MTQPPAPAVPNHSLHPAPEELVALSPDELLQACLEYRSLLLTIMGILSTTDIGLTVRAVALDLVYLQAQRSSQGEVRRDHADGLHQAGQPTLRSASA
jgi:hypothetical protein